MVAPALLDVVLGWVTKLIVAADVSSSSICKLSMRELDGFFQREFLRSVVKAAKSTGVEDGSWAGELCLAITFLSLNISCVCLCLDQVFVVAPALLVEPPGWVTSHLCPFRRLSPLIVAAEVSFSSICKLSVRELDGFFQREFLRFVVSDAKSTGVEDGSWADELCFANKNTLPLNISCWVCLFCARFIRLIKLFHHLTGGLAKL